MYELMNRVNSIICGPKNESLLDFIDNFKKNYPDFLKKNVIIDLSKFEKIKNADLTQFLTTAKLHLKNNTSFVIVSLHTDIENLPEELVTVPSLIEALDIIELDEFSRDLGF